MNLQDLPPTVVNFLACMLAAGFFGLGRGHADDLDKGLALAPRLRLYSTLFAMGLLGGVIAPPLADIAQALPIPNLVHIPPRSVMLAIACIVGWEGLPRSMRKIESLIEKITKLKGEAPHDRLPESAVPAPDVPDHLEASGPGSNLPPGPLGLPPDSQ